MGLSFIKYLGEKLAIDSLIYYLVTVRIQLYPAVSPYALENKIKSLSK